MQAEPPKRPELACSDAPWLQALGVAWDYLEDSDSLKAIRACCREARALHARQLSKLVVRVPFGAGPDPAEVSRGVLALRELGTRLVELALDLDQDWDWIHSPELGPAPDEGRREQQIVAALEACRGPGAPSTLKVKGKFCISRPMCEALASLQPSNLSLHSGDWSSVLPRAGPARDRAVYWAGELLRRCLPHLESLSFTINSAFPSVLVLSLCHSTTALRSLDIQLIESMHSIHVTAEAQMALDAIVELRGLQNLKLTTYDLRPFKSGDENKALLDLRCLSALTGLTSLSLELLLLSQESMSRSFAPEEQLARMRPAWREQRAGLVAALREMGGLAELRLIFVELDAPCLPQLTALTSLTVHDIRLPTDEEAAALEVPGAGGGHTWALPPRLEVLQVIKGMSPSLASKLAAPPSLRSFGNSVVLCFDHRDWVAEAQAGEDEVRYRLRPEACAAVTAAVGFTNSVDPDVCCLSIKADFSPEEQLLPPAGAADAGGHAAWLSALAPLPVEELSVSSIAFEVLDLMALVDAMPWLTELDLEWAYVPWAAMPVLSRLRSLSTLYLPAYVPEAGAGIGSVQHLAKSILLQLMLTAPSLEYVRLHPHGCPRELVVAVAGEVQGVLDARGVEAHIEVL
ncbi:hypothetical protein HYH03_016816 [Edaphochlamys debaryana]|uniref:Uncharacterized protein n=1 Tax=Edaphochlamys debaryana TaxID=47281 RepID=A0A835XJP1_9CHLO|nr:hypothetical protein HYH03_016816 [Edaphochlamys debaryana]|eukprot:KAG2484402.1 hypothetical protein HYH03_016816 [Edaphochlamys debaryana]